MAAFSNFLENALLDVVLKDAATALGGGGTLYVSLHTAWTQTTGDAGTFTEVTGGSYARKSIAGSAWTIDDAAGVITIDNDAALTFTTATANWGNILAFGIWDALTTGNLYFHGQLTTPVQINSGDTFEFAAAALAIELQ